EVDADARGAAPHRPWFRAGVPRQRMTAGDDGPVTSCPTGQFSYSNDYSTLVVQLQKICATKLAQEDARCDRDWPAGRLGGGATGNIRGSRADRGAAFGFAA